jgi:hypothetical protein
MWDNTAFWLVARFNPWTGPKKLKMFQLFIIRPATSPDQSEPKIPTDGACADFVLFRSGPIRCLFSGCLYYGWGGGGGGGGLFCRFWTVFSWKLYSRYCTVGSLYTFVRFSKVFSDFSFARRGVFWIFDAYKRDICFQNFQTISKLDGWRKCRWTFINTHTNDSRLIRVFQQTFMFIFPWNVVFIPWMVNYNWKQI